LAGGPEGVVFIRPDKFNRATLIIVGIKLLILRTVCSLRLTPVPNHKCFRGDVFYGQFMITGTVDRKCHIAKKKCVRHGGRRWRSVGRVNAAWVPHGDHTQRLKRLKRLERRRNVMCVQNALNGGRTHISRARTTMHSERHARSDRWHGEHGNSANEVCI
jgi:hypothetical protein